MLLKWKYGTANYQAIDSSATRWQSCLVCPNCVRVVSVCVRVVSVCVRVVSVCVRVVSVCVRVVSVCVRVVSVPTQNSGHTLMYFFYVIPW